MTEYTPQQVADLLKVSTSMLALWRASGVGPRFVERGRTIRYLHDDVTAWADRRPEPYHHPAWAADDAL